MKMTLELLSYRPTSFSYVKDVVLMLITWNLHKKSNEVSIKTRSTLASFRFIGLVTKHNCEMVHSSSLGILPEVPIVLIHSSCSRKLNQLFVEVKKGVKSLKLRIYHAVIISTIEIWFSFAFYSWIYPRVLVGIFMQICHSCVTGSSI